MSFMQTEITRKGALYSCECSRCGSTLYTHEWANWDHNERRDAMQEGTLRCDECSIGSADAETFSQLKGKFYAGRLSAPGYLDCTDWTYSMNKRVLKRDLVEMYGTD